jgi:arylformamidase
MRIILATLLLTLSTLVAQEPKPPLSQVYEESTGQPAFWNETFNVQYARPSKDHKSERLVSLDIYSPQNTPPGQRLPAIIIIHGGSWKSGDKDNLPVVGNKVPFFISEGFIFISINYGLTPEIKYPQQPQDIADAIAFVHKHADEYGIDENDINLMGHSAGAQLAALVSTDGKFLLKAGRSTKIIRRAVILDGISNLVTKIQQDARDGNETNDHDIKAAFGSTRAALEAGSPVYQVKSFIKDYTPPMMFYFRGNRARARDDLGMISVLRKNGVAAGGVYVQTYSHSDMNSKVGIDDILTPSILAFLRGGDPKELSAAHY